MIDLGSIWNFKIVIEGEGRVRRSDLIIYIYVEYFNNNKYVNVRPDFGRREKIKNENDKKL